MVSGGEGGCCVGQMNEEEAIAEDQATEDCGWTVILMVNRQGKKGFKRCSGVKSRQPSLMG